jgi:hypothetical protein
VRLLLVATLRAGPITPELRQANSPVTLAAASGSSYRQIEFRYRGLPLPPVIRVQPGKTLKVESE